MAKEIALLTPNKKEQIEMLLLWSFEYMKPDAARFFNGGEPLSTSVAFTQRLGLCDELSSIVSDFCKTLSIPCMKVTGYVKYTNFKAGDKFYETNHAWNVIRIDDQWKSFDLFWSICELKENASKGHQFKKRLTTDYLFPAKASFLQDHLPADPVFQFQNYPISITAFTGKVTGIDSTVAHLPFLHYKDSLQAMARLTPQTLNLRTAKHEYAFNPSNPNSLITEYFNSAVDIVNSAQSKKADLQLAGDYFRAALSLLEKSKNPDIKALKENCKQGLDYVSLRMARARS
ncbi:transglutaminase domain-containing protein [Chryseolinea lacunae]|uniref:transglutaminase domain-containing protein n=1 Tax=Chryseolinea lacunae TaxID=2801331 RepID=UPI001920178C|nr:transglutaminase domain-containing protein [Chryseolinea lacunae]